MFARAYYIDPNWSIADAWNKQHVLSGFLIKGLDIKGKTVFAVGMLQNI
jgi:hypothetical protein